MAAGIKCDVYYDRVEIKMIGEKPITILRPASVTLDDWDRFWGRRYPMQGYARPCFTRDDAEANNRRRLASIPR